MKYDITSIVEEKFLEKSGCKSVYGPTEKIKSVVVENFPTLGKFTALRFIEWVQKNPGGVVSLPTGKTPEHFIKWMQYFLSNWKLSKVNKELKEYGINTSKYPDIKSLHFVQIDEFYPISPTQQNSFYYYIKKFYFKEFGFDEKKALLIDTSKIGIPEGLKLEDVFPDYKVDLSLRYRQAKTHMEHLQKNAILAIDQFCSDYEKEIQKKGGIGFFLGGIGPDGHIGFNVSGSDFFSTTRLTPINYETAAAAASDLGGVEVSRNRLVITIGLSTITQRKDAVQIIIAAGEAKAKIVADSIQQPKNIKYPASVLQDAPNARFYLTHGAAANLIERIYLNLKNKTEVTEEDEKRHLLNYSFNHKKKIDDITLDELKKDRFNIEVINKRKRSAEEIKKYVRSSILSNIDKGLLNVKNETILHTSPHHDDEMLGYLPYIIKIVREPSNKNYFSYLTSGFTSVTNKYMLYLTRNLQRFINTAEFVALLNDGYFDSSNIEAKNNDIYNFLDGLAANMLYPKEKALAKRLLRILIEVLEDNDITNIKNRLGELINYFQTQYPGKKDLEFIQKIKGMVREFEAELVWGYFGFHVSSVFHKRLGFYTGDIFTENPEMERDVYPILNMIREVKPTIVTVAFDPEGSGPDTHYKVLQAITEALKIYEKETGISNIRIWGYRNVWYRFHPSEANMYVPVSLNSMALLNYIFLNCFGSQKEASFPSYQHDGPFSELAQKIMVEQYEQLKTFLGEEFFYNNYHPQIRATRGFVYLKEMSLKEFYNYSYELKKLMTTEK